MIRSFVSAFALMAISASAIAQAQPTTDILPLEGVATLVNDEPISYFDVRQRMLMLLVTSGAQPSPEVVQQLSNTALQQLVDERLQLQLAKELELEVSPERIHNNVERIAQQSGATMEALEAEFSNAGISMRTLEEQVRADIAWQDIMRGRYGRNIRISKDRISAQMALLESDSTETAYQISEIFLFAPDQETKLQARTAADILIEQLRNGTPFAAMAQQLSKSPTAAAGGDMGWVSIDDLQPEIAAAVTKADRPGILEPVVTESGVYILVVRNRRDPQEAISQMELMQIIATDNKKETIEAALNLAKQCDALKDVADNSDNMIMANLGNVKLSDLAPEAQQRLASVQAGQTSAPFEMSRGWSALAVCSRKDGAANLPSDDQLENQLYGRELGMISERELRNARLEATILGQ